MEPARSSSYRFGGLEPAPAFREQLLSPGDRAKPAYSKLSRKRPFLGPADWRHDASANRYDGSGPACTPESSGAKTVIMARRSGQDSPSGIGEQLA
jgi:hypothetical protein